jgi:hypothetical protein
MGTTKLKRAAATMVVAAMVALPLWGPGATTASASTIPCRSFASHLLRTSTFDIVQIKTFYVTIKPASKSYSVGDTVKVAALVTRPAHEDPLNNGVKFDPPASAPASDVNVGIGLHISNKVYLPGFGITDANGKVTVSIKLPSYTPAGVASVDAFAYKNDAEAPCFTLQENGFTTMPNAFTVSKS